MKKNAKRTMAMLIALAICAAQLALPAAALENQEIQTVITIDGGSMTVTEKNETTTNGSTTTSTDTTIKEWSQGTEALSQDLGEDSSTTTVVGNETTVRTDITDESGLPLQQSETVAGSETTTKTTEITTESSSRESSGTDTTDNGYRHDPDADTDTGWVSHSRNQGADTYTDASLSQEPGNVRLDMTQKKKTDTETILLDLEQAVKDNISLPPSGTTSVTNPDGSVTETLVEYVYQSNIVIGYTKTVTTVYSETREDQQYTRGETETFTESTADAPVITGETIFLLPPEPEAATLVHEDGSISASTVEQILDESGNHIGYKTITVTTHPDGTVTQSSQSSYGTEVNTHTESTTTNTTITETTELTKDKVTITTSLRFLDAEGFELVWDGANWVYAAQLGKVKEGKNHGDVEITPLTPTSLVLNGKQYVFNRPDSTVTPAKNHNSPDGYDYNYTGVRGEGSQYQVKTSKSYDSDAHMFQLKVGKDTFYVYCVDFATTATPNYNYTIQNVADATYYGEAESKHIQAIGTYGYWGTTGTNADGSPVKGSLAALKANLTAARKAAAKAGKTFCLTQKQIDALTEGEALTATQAAFWTYGNSGGSTIDATQKTETITGLYQWLIAQEAPVTESTDIIDADEFAQAASITVKEKATHADGSVKTVDGKEVYTADVSFTIDVTQSSLTGNLKVSIVQDGKTIREVQLATADSNILGKILSGGKEVGTSVTFTDLELIEGVTFTINLDGTQELEEGVYIYTSEKINGKPSQTFVGLAQGEHTVDLAVDMKFTVSEPGVRVKDPISGPSQKRVETQTQRKTDTETVVTQLTDVEVVTLTVENSKREWESSWEKEYIYEYPVDPLRDDTIIEEEDVPIADAPQTGDISLIFAAVSLVSAGGLWLLNRKIKDED